MGSTSKKRTKGSTPMCGTLLFPPKAAYETFKAEAEWIVIKC